jgi:hypothetical protein
MNWIGLSGVTYQTFYSIDLTNWFPYGLPIPGTNAPMQLLVPIGAEPILFFRLSATN